MDLGLQIKELARLVHVRSDTDYKLGAKECQTSAEKPDDGQEIIGAPTSETVVSAPKS